eukprot:CAMPEP_0176103550 /NCGR_PEP_ID=MMETSP0120_2-20121206/51954_1 /TAXON_ID=160619 /ORGANISM="Kryptoperidinium foliaceum, Strain CCMP 1326" /LENGTH=90 /DNA_ID=CAMNT_0017437641 /DNA_START=18 /DNA_END=286 /DNA_ORIENTATION=-
MRRPSIRPPARTVAAKCWCRRALDGSRRNESVLHAWTPPKTEIRETTPARARPPRAASAPRRKSALHPGSPPATSSSPRRLARPTDAAAG